MMNALMQQYLHRFQARADLCALKTKQDLWSLDYVAFTLRPARKAFS